AVCDEVNLDPSLVHPDSINKTDTYVFAGLTTPLGRELGENEALLATSDNGKTYLIYRLPSTPNRPNANTVRAEIDLGANNAVKSALQLPDRARKISQGLLNTIPEVGRLSPPDIEGKGSQPTAGFDGLFVGDVFSTSPAGGQPEYWAITQSGIQKISGAVADIMRVAKNGSAGRTPNLGLDKLSGVHQLQPGDPGYIPVDDFPRSRPTVLDATQGSPVACLGWSLVGDATNQDSHTSVFVSDQLPGPKDAANKTTAVKVNTPGPNGVPITGFYMQPGFGAVVQSATGKASFGKGPIQLISDRGIRYGVPDAKTADGLGLTNRQPAPESIISLLPPGAELNTQDVLRQFDTVPIDPNAGVVPPATKAPGN
ncbi:MAG TPA: type VII secretion protein EccB, partial [Amycolatopsis sp.]|nr:type VII secretion protein EccB [Amycolatopsis sp.]